MRTLRHPELVALPHPFDEDPAAAADARGADNGVATLAGIEPGVSTLKGSLAQGSSASYRCWATPHVWHRAYLNAKDVVSVSDLPVACSTSTVVTPVQSPG